MAVPIYPETETPYTCAICGRDTPRDWESPQMKSRKPTCWFCEQEWGTGPYGDCNPDRRTLKRLSALITAIEIEAHRKSLKLEPFYGRT